MTDLLRDLLSRPGAARTVIVLEAETASTPRQYEVRPGYALYAAVIGIVGLAAFLIALVVLTPLRGLVLGPGTGQLRGVASENARRATALEDSLAVQYQQIAQLRAIVTGEMDSLGEGALDPSSFSLPDPGPNGPAAGRRRPHVGGGAGEAATARPSRRSPSTRWAPPATALGTRGAAADYLVGLRLPALPPVDGVRSRGFDAGRGHFAVDLAAAEGTPVRAFGGGYVVLADWTHDGGHTIAVQHPGGYLSVYKHNSRLLKRVGDRVRAREAVALSGNTGGITSGPPPPLRGLARRAGAGPVGPPPLTAPRLTGRAPWDRPRPHAGRQRTRSATRPRSRTSQTPSTPPARPGTQMAKKDPWADKPDRFDQSDKAWDDRWADRADDAGGPDWDEAVSPDYKDREVTPGAGDGRLRRRHARGRFAPRLRSPDRRLDGVLRRPRHRRRPLAGHDPVGCRYRGGRGGWPASWCWSSGWPGSPRASGARGGPAAPRQRPGGGPGEGAGAGSAKAV